MAEALAVVLMLLGGWASWPSPASAHAYLTQSDPANNSILPERPSRVVLVYSEPLERGYSQATLYDQAGTALPGTGLVAGPDDFSMTLTLPADLPRGTFSVLWRTLSTADGHTGQGYITFTHGNDTSVQSIVIPTTEGAGGPPEGIRAVSRWLAYLGLAATLAIWPMWVLVLRPGIAPVWQVGPAMIGRMRRYGLAAFALALLGNVVSLTVQALGTDPDRPLAAVEATLRDTRYGEVWLFRMAVLFLYGLLLANCAWWRPWKRGRLLTLLTLAVTVALPLPFSLVAHAAARPTGREMAIASDLVHLYGASLWVGGLLVLTAVLGPTLGHLTGAGRKAVLGRVLPRFSAVALAAWGVMGITGLYAAWLQVGNFSALRATAYGESLTQKLLLTLPLLALAAFNLLVVTRRLRRSTGEGVIAWSGRFRAAVAVEVVIVAVVLLVAGRLVGQAPARDDLERQDDQVVLDLAAEGRDARLAIAPGTSGLNHFRLEVAGADLPPDSLAIMRLTLPGQGTGQSQVEMTRAAGNAFEWHGSELALPGDWTVQTVVRQPGQADWAVTTTLELGRVPPDLDIPGPAWRFGPSAILGLALVVVGVIGVAAASQGRWAVPARKVVPLGTAAMALGLMVTIQARADLPGERLAATSPLALDVAAVTRGQETYTSYCLACHGPGGDGDGPLAASLPHPPADLTSAHGAAHSDEDLLFWVENGIRGTSMPAFGDTLTPDQTRDVIAYVRAMQEGAIALRDAPDPAECVVAPRDLASLSTLAATPGAARPPVVAEIPVPGATPALPEGTAADPGTTGEVRATLRQVIACSNARDTMRRMALFSDGNLRASFPAGPTGAFADLVATPPVVLPVVSRIAIVAYGEVRLLPDGRVVTSVTLDNPSSHNHDLTVSQDPSAGTRQVAVVYLVRQGDRWVVDEEVY